MRAACYRSGVAAILDNVRARPAVPSVLVAVAIDDAVAVVQITVDPAGRASRVDVVADPPTPGARSRGSHRHGDDGADLRPLRPLKPRYLLDGNENVAPSRTPADGQRWVIVLRFV